jgi:hypothetical protein
MVRAFYTTAFRPSPFFGRLDRQLEVDLGAVESNEIRKYVTWGVFGLFAFALYSEVGFRKKPPPQRTFTEGEDTDVAITLVSTDVKALSCASAEEVGGRHCEYQSKTERWNKPSTSGRAAGLDTLAPYKTTDDTLLLVPALFNDPALRQRLTIDPPTFGQEHMRFVANCKMHVEGKMKEVDVRWATNGQWQPQKDVWIGSVTACWLSEG